MNSPSSPAQSSNSTQPLKVEQNVSRGNGQNGVHGNRPLAGLARRLRENELFTSLVLGCFRGLQRLGISVTPNHFYWPVPDIAELEHRKWPARMPTTSFDYHFDRQLELLRTMKAEYAAEWSFPEQSTNGGYHYNNGFFETVDAEIAYSFVRKFKPTRIVEVGTGLSTRILAASLQANLRDGRMGGELVSIDPMPARLPQNGFSDLVTVIPRRVQDVDLSVFQSLRRNDILFIDSSHVVATGNDVVREYLDIVPNLQPGVLVHLHDIFLPSDYPREAELRNMCFWSEQYLLQAFLSFNSSFEVLWASSAMQAFHREALDAAFPRWKSSHKKLPKSERRWVPSVDGQRIWPSSFWMRRI
jgi:predicted O-methyltransferase YrrM